MAAQPAGIASRQTEHSVISDTADMDSEGVLSVSGAVAATRSDDSEVAASDANSARMQDFPSGDMSHSSAACVSPPLSTAF